MKFPKNTEKWKGPDLSGPPRPGLECSGSRKPVRWAYPILLALPLIVLNGGWIANSEMKTGITEITISTLFTGVLFFLFVVTLLNLAVRRAFGLRAALNQPELMVLYTMLSISSVVSGIGNFGFLPFLSNAFWFGTPQSGWPTFWYLLPSYMGPRDHTILRGFYEGQSSFFQPHIMAAWAFPLAIWGLFFLVLLWTTLCLSIIVRRRWQEEEHLPFPVIVLPLEMTREGAPLYRNRLLWLGFALPCSLHSLNSLHSLYPTLPTLPINRLQDMVTGLHPPWTGFDSIPYLLHPAGVGIGFLINTDVLFSLWFFFLAKKVLNLFGVLMNWRDAGHGLAGDGVAQFPYTGYQAWGAWLALCLSVLWVGWPYFRAYFHRALRGDPEGKDTNEPLTAREATLGFTLGFLALCTFVWVAGGSWWLPVVFLGLYVLIMLALSRLHAETAVVSSYLMWIDPQSILIALHGTAGMSQLDIAHTGMLSWFNFDYRASGMPHELEGFVGLDRAGGRLRPLVGAILLAAVVAIVSALLWDMQLYYVNGAGTARVNGYRINMGNAPWWALIGWLHTPKPPTPLALPGMVIGAGMTLFLGLMRARFAGFPLSPAAYVLDVSWANDLFWCDMFVAWFCKSLLLRYGGIKMYRQALPFFLGLILGDFVTGSAWSIIGVLFHLDLYRTFPN